MRRIHDHSRRPSCGNTLTWTPIWPRVSTTNRPTCHVIRYSLRTTTRLGHALCLIVPGTVSPLISSVAGSVFSDAPEGVVQGRAGGEPSQVRSDALRSIRTRLRGVQSLTNSKKRVNNSLVKGHGKSREPA